MADVLAVLAIVIGITVIVVGVADLVKFFKEGD